MTYVLQFKYCNIGIGKIVDTNRATRSLSNVVFEIVYELDSDFGRTNGDVKRAGEPCV